MSSDRLNVIALISGGKDSFYSLLHCIKHGHRIVALANLYPSRDGTGPARVQEILPHESIPPQPITDETSSDERDLNSFMYQTVGHEVIPLYAQATGLPLYRQPILGSAVHHERDYSYDVAATDEQGSGSIVPDNDETESMLPLLRETLAKHPEANAICSGAILSTYQRTRVESVALRLGLTPLSYLWKYPALPPPAHTAADEAQLLRDMAVAGLEARIIKVASAGLDERHLWERVSSEVGVDRIKAALRKFGSTEGASLGEGGEFETLVVDGPAVLFKKRVEIPVNGRRPISEGGGSTWLMMRGAHLEDKPAEEASPLLVREPGLWDAKFQDILDSILKTQTFPDHATAGIQVSKLRNKFMETRIDDKLDIHSWALKADSTAVGKSIQDETINIVDKIRSLLSKNNLDPSQITSTIVVLRDMNDFPKINGEYGKLFSKSNPPSRITISSGDLLPGGRNILINVTTPVAGAKTSRNGLHVQARSYWAPANIGPYSQAIETAVTCRGEDVGLRSVLIAGQIPLLPASMSLPPTSDTVLHEQVVLSLQHLWRIATEMKVQWWSSAVAYFASSTSDEAALRYRAKLAGRAWNMAHGSPDDEDEEGDGIDPWDLKYNTEYQTVGGGDASNPPVSVPDWSIFTLRQQNEPASCVPPVFAAEIQSLPRQSMVEWHAHTGLKHIDEGSAEMIHCPSLGGGQWQAWHMLAKTPAALVIYTTVAGCQVDSSLGTSSMSDLQDATSAVYQESLRAMQPNLPSSSEEKPHLLYVNMSTVGGLWHGDEQPEMDVAVIPCRTLWDAQGKQLKCVSLYRTMF